MESFDEGSARIKESTVGAQKTGAVWECCEKLKTIPRVSEKNIFVEAFLLLIFVYVIIGKSKLNEARFVPMVTRL